MVQTLFWTVNSELIELPIPLPTQNVGGYWGEIKMWVNSFLRLCSCRSCYAPMHSFSLYCSTYFNGLSLAFDGQHLLALYAPLFAALLKGTQLNRSDQSWRRQNGPFSLGVPFIFQHSSKRVSSHEIDYALLRSDVCPEHNASSWEGENKRWEDKNYNYIESFWKTTLRYISYYEVNDVDKVYVILYIILHYQ